MNNEFTQYKYFLIVDLEATCCDQQSIARNEMETIEIGAVMVESSKLCIVDEFSVFIKPSNHPVLTAFCTSLTSITQADVDSAPAYPEAIDKFKSWLSQYDSFLFCSWGDYDKNQLAQDSRYHNIAYPFGSEHVNIKKLFSSSQKLSKKYGMAGALRKAGLALDGTHHRGIDDARNMAKLMPFIVGKRKIL